MTDCVAFVERQDWVWQYSTGRSTTGSNAGPGGWASAAVIALLLYGGFELIEKLRPQTRRSGRSSKVGLLALLGGVVILFVSVLRERVYFWSRDRYKDVRR